MPSLSRRISLVVALTTAVALGSYSAGAKGRTSVPAVLTTTTSASSWSPSGADRRPTWRGNDCGGFGCYGWNLIERVLPATTGTAARLVTFEADLDIPAGDDFVWPESAADPQCDVYFQMETRVPQEGAVWYETSGVPVIPETGENWSGTDIYPGSPARTIHAGGAGLALQASSELLFRTVLYVSCWDNVWGDDTWTGSSFDVSSPDFIARNIAYSVTTFGK